MSPMEQRSFEIEGIGQAVRRVDAHHQRAMPAFSEFEPGRRGDAGLSDAAFAAEKKNAHVLLQIRTKANGDWFVLSFARGLLLFFEVLKPRRGAASQ